MNNKSNEKGNMVLKAAFAMLAAGLPMQYASANGNAAPNALTQTQGAVVQGTVKDGTGEPLIGVSVVVKGATGLGVVTDIDGMSVEIMQLFSKLNEELKRTIILVTHEEDIALYAKRIIKIVDGEIQSDTINKKGKNK